MEIVNIEERMATKDETVEELQTALVELASAYQDLTSYQEVVGYLDTLKLSIQLTYGVEWQE